MKTHHCHQTGHRPLPPRRYRMLILRLEWCFLSPSLRCPHLALACLASSWQWKQYQKYQKLSQIKWNIKIISWAQICPIPTVFVLPLLQQLQAANQRPSPLNPVQWLTQSPRQLALGRWLLVVAEAPRLFALGFLSPVLKWRPVSALGGERTDKWVKSVYFQNTGSTLHLFLDID